MTPKTDICPFDPGYLQRTSLTVPCHCIVITFTMAKFRLFSFRCIGLIEVYIRQKFSKSSNFQTILWSQHSSRFWGHKWILGGWLLSVSLKYSILSLGNRKFILTNTHSVSCGAVPYLSTRQNEQAASVSLIYGQWNILTPASFKTRDTRGLSYVTGVFSPPSVGTLSKGTLVSSTMHATQPLSVIFLFQADILQICWGSTIA